MSFSSSEPLTPQQTEDLRCFNELDLEQGFEDFLVSNGLSLQIFIDLLSAHGAVERVISVLNLKISYNAHLKDLTLEMRLIVAKTLRIYSGATMTGLEDFIIPDLPSSPLSDVCRDITALNRQLEAFKSTSGIVGSDTL